MDVGDKIEAEMESPKHEKHNRYFPPDKKYKKNNEDSDKKSRECLVINDIRKSSLYNLMLLGIIFIVAFYILKIRGCF